MLLVRIDHEKRMDRWYAVFATMTLFGEPAVLCMWGSRRTAYQRHRLIPCRSPQEARELAERILRRKQGRGYRPAQ